MFHGTGQTPSSSSTASRLPHSHQASQAKRCYPRKKEQICLKQILSPQPHVLAPQRHGFCFLAAGHPLFKISTLALDNLHPLGWLHAPGCSSCLKPVVNQCLLAPPAALPGEAEEGMRTLRVRACPCCWMGLCLSQSIAVRTGLCYRPPLSHSEYHNFCVTSGQGRKQTQSILRKTFRGAKLLGLE